MEETAQRPEAKYIPRDLSWLLFNERVLEEAVDSKNPLLERVKFLSIFANNLDEFFMVRVASLQRIIDSGYSGQDPSGLLPQDLHREIKAKASQLIKRLYEIYQGKILKELDKNKIYIKKFEELNPEQKRFVKRYFENTLFPVVTPL